MISLANSLPTIKEQVAAMETVDITKPSERSIAANSIPKFIPASSVQLLMYEGYRMNQQESMNKMIQLPFHKVADPDSCVFCVTKMKDGSWDVREVENYLDDKVLYQVPIVYEQKNATSNTCMTPFYGKLRHMSRSFGPRFKEDESKEDEFDQKVIQFLRRVKDHPDAPTALKLFAEFREDTILNLKEVLENGLMVKGDWEIFLEKNTGKKKIRIKSKNKEYLYKTFMSPLFCFRMEGEESFTECFGNPEITNFWHKFYREYLKEQFGEIRCQLSGEMGSPIDIHPYLPGYSAKLSGTSEDYDCFINPGYYGGDFLPYTAPKRLKAQVMQQYIFACSHDSAEMITTAANYLRQRAVLRLSYQLTDKELWIFPDKMQDGVQMLKNPAIIQEEAENQYQDELDALLNYSMVEQEKNQEVDPGQDARKAFWRCLNGWSTSYGKKDELYWYVCVEALNKKQVTFSSVGWFTFEMFQKHIMDWQKYGNVPVYVEPKKDASKGPQKDFCMICAPAYSKLIIPKYDESKPERKRTPEERKDARFVKEAVDAIEKEIGTQVCNPLNSFFIPSQVASIMLQALKRIGYKEIVRGAPKHLYFRQLMAAASLIMKRYRMEEIIMNLGFLETRVRNVAEMSDKEREALRAEIEKGLEDTTLDFLHKEKVSERERVSFLYGRMFAIARHAQVVYEWRNKSNRIDIMNKKEALLNNYRCVWELIDHSLMLIQGRMEDSKEIRDSIDTVRCLYYAIGDSYKNVHALDGEAFLLGEAAQESYYFMNNRIAHAKK